MYQKTVLSKDVYKALLVSRANLTEACSRVPTKGSSQKLEVNSGPTGHLEIGAWTEIDTKSDQQLLQLALLSWQKPLRKMQDAPSNVVTFQQNNSCCSASSRYQKFPACVSKACTSFWLVFLSEKIKRNATRCVCETWKKVLVPLRPHCHTVPLWGFKIHQPEINRWSKHQYRHMDTWIFKWIQVLLKLLKYLSTNKYPAHQGAQIADLPHMNEAIKMNRVQGQTFQFIILLFCLHLELTNGGAFPWTKRETGDLSFCSITWHVARGLSSSHLAVTGTNGQHIHPRFGHGACRFKMDHILTKPNLPTKRMVHSFVEWCQHESNKTV